MQGRRDKPKLSIHLIHVDSLTKQPFHIDKAHLIPLRDKKRHSMTTTYHKKPRNSDLAPTMGKNQIKHLNNLGQSGQIFKNTFLNLPEIKLKTSELNENVQSSQALLQNYSSAKWSRGNNYKIDKNLSTKYHQKMQSFKQIKTPVIAQKIFTITHMQNYDLDVVKKQMQSTKRAIPQEKKLFHASLNLQKFQMAKMPDTRVVPFELKAIKIIRECRYNYSSVQTQQKGLPPPWEMEISSHIVNTQIKKTYRNKQDGLNPQQVKRHVKHMQSFRIEAWQNDINQGVAMQD